MILELPRSQDLRFVNISSYPPAMFNFDNTLLHDEGRFHDEPYPYFQKFDTTDDITVQIRTDYTTISLIVYDSANQAQQTVTLTDQNAGLTGATLLQGTIDTSTLGGIYYAKIVASSTSWSTFTFQSEYFEIDNWIAEKLPRLTWKGSVSDGLYYDNGAEFGFRVECDIYNYKGDLETDNFKAYNSVIVNVASKIGRICELKTDEIPRYIYEKILLGLSHDHFYINGVEYVSISGIEDEPIPDTVNYNLICTLQETNYEQYATLSTTGGGDEPTPSDGKRIVSTGNKRIVSAGNYRIVY